MKDREKVLNRFISEILRIERELDKLDDSSYELFTLYNRQLFPEQEKLAVNIENMVTALTHETASTIGFMRNDLAYLSKFIDFREKYSNFTDAELDEILETNISISLKKDLLNRFETAEDMLKQINELRQKWNVIFNNQSYAKIKSKFANSSSQGIRGSRGD
jgi:hypothetical protein